MSSHLDSSYSWIRLAVSVAAGTVASVGMWAIILVMPQIQAEFGVDRGGSTIAYTAVMTGFALGNVLLGRLVDRFGIAAVLTGAGLTIGAGYWGSANSESIAMLSAWHFVIGIATAAGFGPLMADISHWFLGRRGIAVACTAAGNYLAGSLWPQALKNVIAEDGWRPAFTIIAITTAIALPLLALMLRRRLPEEKAGHPVAAPRFAGRVDSGLSPGNLQMLLVVAGFGCCMAMAMPQVHMVSYCFDLGYGTVAGAEMLSLMLGAGIVSRLLSGFLADYIGGVRTLLVGSVMQCLALFLYIPFDGLASLYVVSFVFGLSQGGIVPSYAIIVREYMPAREAGARVGIVVMATVVGMALGGWMSGWIYDLTGSYQAAFVNGIAWNLLNIAVMTWLLWRTRTPAAVMA